MQTQNDSQKCYEHLGHNPLYDAIQEWVAEEKIAHQSPSAPSHLIDQCRRSMNVLSILVQKYLPNVRRKNVFISPRIIKLMRIEAHELLLTGQCAHAYQKYKHICELTVDVVEDWRQLVSLAKRLYSHIVPTLCAQMSNLIADPSLRFQEQGLLDFFC